MNISKLFLGFCLSVALSGYAQSPVFSPPNGSASTSTTTPQNFSGPLSTPTMRSSVRPAIDVTAPPFNAAMDGVTDDTAAINAAIVAAYRSTVNCGLGATAPTASCTGVVLIPNGALIASQIVMMSNVTLAGTGWNNSVLIQKAGANENFIVGTTPATDQRFYIHDLFINGNASAQTGTGDCIHFDSTGTLADSTRSPRHTLQNDFVANCKQDAISLQGDAGSEYLYNVKGMNSGRYGLNMNVFDSHADVCEFAQNGVAGVFTGTNGNGSIASCKIWGNGTGTTGTGVLLNAPNYRLVNNDIQDNACNGLVVTSAASETVEGNYLDGNGQTGGGLGCSGLVLNNVTNSTFIGNVNGVVDAGQSDYGITFSGTNTNNLIVFTINNDKIAQINGSPAGNTVILNGNVYSSATTSWYNGAITRWYSDAGTTEQASFNGSTGQLNVKQFNTSTSGWSVFAVGGPNNFDFTTNQNFITLNASGAGYQMAEGCTGTGCPATLPLKFTMPTQFTQLTTTGDCVSIGASNAPADVGYHCTQPRATFSGTSGTSFASLNTQYGGAYTPTAAITVTGFDVHLDTAPVTCTGAYPTVAVYDETAAAVVSGSSLPLNTSAHADYHVSLATGVPAGHLIEFATTVAAATCTTSPASPHFTVEYLMQ